ncbi:MAG: hypothetical protein Q8P18_05400 [Pseudomonadota bacterium]|nr:hypothetical protein [Pseudomonadota bacterium]
MLAWTSAGAVPRPRTLQLRLHRSYPDRVAAGAPPPSRSLSTDEVVANLRWFTAASARGLPVDALVLSGGGVPTRSDLPELLGLARSLGITRAVLHAGVDDLGGPPTGVDRYVLPVRLGPGGADPASLRAAFAGARAAGVPVDANVPLARNALPSLVEATTLAREGGAASVTFTYPFPTGSFPSEADLPPSVPEAVAALASAIPLVDGALPVAIKGLPGCWLGPHARLLRKSRNRWYVDADHQLDAALLFFPGVIAFRKADVCRFCRLDGGCDGSLPAGSGQPANPPIRPVE